MYIVPKNINIDTKHPVMILQISSKKLLYLNGEYNLKAENVISTIGKINIAGLKYSLNVKIPPSTINIGFLNFKHHVIINDNTIITISKTTNNLLKYF